MMSTNGAQGPIAFLKNKVGHYSPAQLLWSEFEGWLLWIFNGLPGALGFAARNFIAGMLFQTKGGFAWIQPRVTLVHCDRLSVGSNLGINSGTYINAIGGITFGNYVLIGSNVTISSGRHPIDGKEPAVFARPAEPMPIVFEDDVWIGAGAVIMPGVTLRRGTVVGANSVVTKDTDEYSVVVGAPARVVRKRCD